MDEIMFRVWCAARGELIEDVPIWNNEVVQLTHVDDGEHIARDWDILGGKDVTVTQYIGLKDKTGAMIYEGDILKYQSARSEYFKMGKVEFKEGRFVLTSVPKRDNWVVDIEWQPDKYFIVGNIFENPEFLD